MMPRMACILATLGLLVSSCSQAATQSTITIAPTGLLTPYHTATPSPIKPTATIQLTIPVTPSPTPTPIIYTVKGNETMIEIAYLYGIDWKDLIAANPEVDPHVMGPGLQLIIPIMSETPEVLSTPTPIAVSSGQPRCYPVGDGGVWCVTAVTNDTETSLENLSVWIGLLNAQGENFVSQVAYSALNILQPGKVMPFLAYFSPPLPEEYQARSEVVSALAVAADDTRYLDVDAKVEKVEISQEGDHATVSGEALIPSGTPGLSQLWILAVGSDANGNILGVRKWKSAGEAQFNITVYSLGGTIDHVEVLVEARP